MKKRTKILLLLVTVCVIAELKLQSTVISGYIDIPFMASQSTAYKSGWARFWADSPSTNLIKCVQFSGSACYFDTLATGAGGVSLKTGNYTAVTGDYATLISFNCASACTLTLPSSPPSSVWWIDTESTGSGVLTVSPNGLNLDGSSSSLTLNQNNGVTIYTNGTNYYTQRGMGSSASAQLIRMCEVVTGDPGSASTTLSNDNDAPAVCGNKFGATLTITSVECYANAGSPTVQPQITGGSSTSILSGALTCGTGSFASGTLSGTPTQTSGQSIDANIVTAGGTAKYIVVRITRTL